MTSVPHGHDPHIPVYAQVAVARPLARSYTYFIPESMRERLRVGSVVQAPLRGGMAGGVVIDIVTDPGFKGRIKPIARHLTPDYFLTRELLDLGRWLAEYYFCSLGEALEAVSMIGLNDLAPRTRLEYALAQPVHWVRHAATVDEAAAGPEGKTASPGHRKVIALLLADDNRPLTPDAIREQAQVGAGVLKTMVERGWLTAIHAPLEAGAPPDAGNEANGPREAAAHALTPHQQEALDRIVEAMREGHFRAFLLHGVTGSGKTEIYLRAIEEALRMGRGALVLVPEISLTPQTVEAFRRRLGPLVGVYHSRLTLAEKYALWQRIERGQTRIVIGARSALFVPLPDLGIVIVDEEHEGSYKQGETPRYHARDTAVMRAARLGIAAVLGSATPSIESLHNAREGKYGWLRLPERVGPHASPVMTVVDLRRFARAQRESDELMISPVLREAIDLRLERGEQTVLLLNRRGFSSRAICLNCEHVFGCPHCDVPMTYHKQGESLRCHWCGHRDAVPSVCPQCGQGDVAKLGLGTQRIEEALARMFPAARALRVDVDSMRRKGAHEEAWDQINSGQADIILGTQMIAKGLHLESVTLVGVILADFGLTLPDFRAAERTYALITQVAGRAGRGRTAGEVIVQSFMPHHYAIDMAARLAEDAFYEKELRQRHILRFPPFARLVALLLTGPDESQVRAMAERLGGILKRLSYQPDNRSVRILGPTPAPMPRLEDQYRWRILARGGQIKILHGVIGQGLAEYEKAAGCGAVNLTIDVDPLDLL
jgi:primosomal protein N' (replication factor Y)